MSIPLTSFPRAKEMLRSAHHIVIFTGAGMSAESGVPTFRDALSGLWSRFSPEALATSTAYQRDPELVWGWYEWRRSKILATEPNAGHRAIAEFSLKRGDVTLATQNVDDLHERAGSVGVLHLHGSLFAPRCIACGLPGQFVDDHPEEPEDGRRIPPPHCAHCDGMLRPGVVWFGESLPQDIWQKTETATAKCDLMICTGTSGIVYPAAGLPTIAASNGAMVIQVNPNETPLDAVAHCNLHGSAATVLPELLAV